MKPNNAILLINPGRYLYAYPPLGLAYLASYLEKNSKFNPAISIIDENAKEIPELLIKKGRPRVVGISATTPQIIRAHKIAKFCKRLDPKIICIIGGVHSTILPAQTLKQFPSFDLGIYGEGEQTFQELIDAIWEKNFRLNKINLSQIKGVIYREDKKIKTSPRRELIAELDSIPIPNRGLFNLKYYLKPRQVIRGVTCRATQVMSSRGCPYDCRFCSSGFMWQRRVRFHSPERFVKELKTLIHFGFNGFYLHDDTFIANKARVVQICKILIKKNYHKKLIWAAQLRPNLIRDENDVKMLRLMKKAGCLQVEYGFESGSQRILSLLKKDSATVEQNQKAIDLTKKADLRIFGNFMIGTQGETKKEILETRKFILTNYAKLDYYQVYPTTPYPGTAIWDICKKENLLKNASWQNFGMGVLDDLVFSNTADSDFVHKVIHELTNKAVSKIALRDKLKWLSVRMVDDPRYVLSMLKGYFNSK